MNNEVDNESQRGISPIADDIETFRRLREFEKMIATYCIMTFNIPESVYYAQWQNDPQTHENTTNAFNHPRRSNPAQL